MWMIKISHAPTLYFEVLLVLLGTFRHFKVFLGIWGTSSYFEVLLRTSEYCEVIWGSFRVLSPQSSVFSLQSSVLTPLFWVLNPHFLVLREVLTCVTWFLMQKTVFVASRNSVYGIFVANIARISTYALWGPNSGLSYLVRTPRKLCQAVFTYKSEKKYIHRWTKKYKSDKVGAAGPVLAHHHYKSSCQSKKYKFKFKYQPWILTCLHITIHTFLIIFVIAIYALSFFFCCG